MLNENDVIESVCKFIEEYEFNIESSCTTVQTGDDIVAYNKELEIYFYIEAKGQTSSKEGTKRYGEEFYFSQKKSHVGEALYRTLVMKNKYNQYVGIALPQNKVHLELIEAIKPSLVSLGIEVFWVKQDKTVEVENISNLF